MRPIGACAITVAALAAAGCGLLAGLEDHRLRPASVGGAGGAGGAGGDDSTTTSSSAAAGGGLPDGVLAQGMAYPHAIAADNQSVYWTTEALGARGIWKADKGGGPPVELARLRDPQISDPNKIPIIGLAIDNANVYWTQDDGQGPCDPTSLLYRSHRVMKVPKAGGAATRMWAGCDDVHPVGIAADAQNVYFAANGTGAIYRIRKNDLAVETLAVSQLYPVAVALNQTDVIWTIINNSDAYIRKSLKTAVNSGPPNLYGTSTQFLQPNALAADAVKIYWVDDGNVRSLPNNSPGAVSTVLASGGGNLSALAVDDAYVYWADATAGTIHRVLTTGGMPEELASSQNDPEGIAVDDDGIYWTNATSGEVAWMPKPGG